MVSLKRTVKRCWRWSGSEPASYFAGGVTNTQDWHWVTNSKTRRVNKDQEQHVRVAGRRDTSTKRDGGKRRELDSKQRS